MVVILFLLFILFIFFVLAYRGSMQRKELHDSLQTVKSHDDEIPPNTWYRYKDWKSGNYYKYSATHDDGCKWFTKFEESVVGMSFRDGGNAVLKMMHKPDFAIFLEREPENEHDGNAVKVMVSATVNDRKVIKHIGYLSRETAKALKGEDEIDVRPYSVHLPEDDHELSLEVKVLVRSSAYKKRTSSEATFEKADPEATFEINS